MTRAETDMTFQIDQQVRLRGESARFIIRDRGHYSGGELYRLARPDGAIAGWFDGRELEPAPVAA